jgi:hypothetical protein
VRLGADEVHDLGSQLDRPRRPRRSSISPAIPDCSNAAATRFD